MKIARNILFLLFLLVLCSTGKKTFAQENIVDSAKIKRYQNHSVGKAVVYSALVPGLGQIYNRKIWKVPFIYGAFALNLYYIDFYNSQYKHYKKQYASDSLDTQRQSFDKQAVSFYRRNRDFNIIIMAGVYLLNIIDASVDAHFYKFDVSDNLSLQVKPAILHTITAQSVVGVRFSFTLK